ncbi:hypothetical protein [Sphingobium sp. Sx8-8]|uniref:hypothetical protein n=1 Tax=Sphingobium sp. Sx8-8 TaxID=2933617 RepID=UPI001F57EFB7|nr:hypothetical protein [Sphingobium sp. Sx8-8]
MATYRMVVITKAADGRVDDLARWYDDQHLPDLLRVPGIVAAERHSLRQIGAPPGMEAYDFMAVYTFETDDPMTVLAECGRRLGTLDMPRDCSLDSSKTMTWIATPECTIR